MDHAKVAGEVVEAVGGASNISAAAHCATRLRLVIADESKINQQALDDNEDLKGTFAAGGMFQIIVGPGDVDQVYAKMVANHGVREVSKDEAKEEAEAGGNIFSRFVKMIADIFVPVLPALIAGGLLMALHSVLTAEGLFGERSVIQMYPAMTDYDALINLVSSAAFAFLPVLVGFSALTLAQITLDDNRHTLLGVALIVRDRDGDAVVLVHIGAVRQGDGNIAALADGYFRVLDGASGFVVLYSDGQCPAVAVLVLPANGGIAVLIGLAAGAGNSDLPIAVSVTGTVVIVLVSHSNEHTLHGALILGEQDSHGSLVGIVQQAGIGETDGQGIVRMESDNSIGNGVFSVGIRDNYQIAAHNGLALTVRSGLIVDLLNGFFL